MKSSPSQILPSKSTTLSLPTTDATAEIKSLMRFPNSLTLPHPRSRGPHDHDARHHEFEYGIHQKNLLFYFPRPVYQDQAQFKTNFEFTPPAATIFASLPLGARWRSTPRSTTAAPGRRDECRDRIFAHPNFEEARCGRRHKRHDERVPVFSTGRGGSTSWLSSCRCASWIRALGLSD